jgi:hypothetical protein
LSLRVRSAVLVCVLACLVASAGCDPPPPEALPADSFAFGVFGDGPYEPWENGRYRRMLADAGDADIAWLIHVGDLLGEPCPDEVYAQRARELAEPGYAVIYTPGDNEWTDCRRGADPLERLGLIRRVFFADPGRSIGSTPIALESQATDSVLGEFRENARWRRGGIVFATVHMVGSGNGGLPFPGRTSASDLEMERRTRAAVEWTAQAFDSARATGAKAVVLAFHAELLNPSNNVRVGFEAFVAELTRQAAAFPGEVIAIHGDGHYQRVDRPFRDSIGGTLENLTRIETFGSPDIGWLRVVMDTVAGHLVRVEPRRMRGFW